MLIKHNYITVIQRRIDGKMSVNDYYINQTPDESKTSKKTIGMAIAPLAEFSDTVNSGTNNNNIKNKQSINLPAAQLLTSAEPKMMERWIDSEYIKKIEEELYEAGTLPYSFLANDKKLTAAIRILTDWNMRSDETKYTGEDCALNYSSYMLFVEAIIEMLTARKETMKLKGAIVTYEKVHDRLTQYIEKGNSPFGKYITIGELLAVATGDFKKACQETTIKNHLH